MSLNADQDQRPAVVMVHGLWMTGLELGLLARRLRGEGFSCHRFPYSSLRQTPVRCADALANFVTELAPHHPVVHLLGHSLGARVIELTLCRHRLSAPGRILALAPPFTDCHVARVLARHNGSKLLLGAAAPLLLSPVPRWRHSRPLGVIAGDRGLGAGALFPGLPKPHDGTIALAETAIQGAAARFTVSAGHLSMLFSREVAALAAAFLQSGAFIAKPVKEKATVVKTAPGTATPCRRSPNQR